MRVAGLVLGIVGGLAAGLLGAKWLVDANELRGEIEAVRAMGVDTGDIDRRVIGAYALLGSLALGIAGGVLALKGRNRSAAGLMIAGGAAPAIFAPVALVFTWILLLGGVVGLMARPKMVL